MEYELKEIVLKVGCKTDTDNVHHPEKAFEIAREYLSKKCDGKEHFCAMHLNNQKRLIAVDHVSMGTMGSSLVHPREVFRPAIISGSSGILLFHNHPSGDTSPSKEDIEITERLEEVGDLVGIPVVDHLIVTEDNYRSFNEMGLL